MEVTRGNKRHLQHWFSEPGAGRIRLWQPGQRQSTWIYHKNIELELKKSSQVPQRIEKKEVEAEGNNGGRTVPEEDEGGRPHNGGT